MGFKRCTATIGKLAILEGARKEAKLIYLHEIVSVFEKHSIPPSLVVNLDQTPSKYVQASHHTMAKKVSQLWKSLVQAISVQSRRLLSYL